MSGKGIIRRELITIVGSTQVVEALSNAHFNKNDIQTYKKIFYDLREKGIIASGDFGNHIWPAYYKGKKITRFIFDLEMYPFMNLALKCFVLLSLNERLDPPNLNAKLTHIKDAIFATHGLSDPNIEETFEAWLSSKTEHVRIRNVPTIGYFISFIGHEKENELLEICDALYPQIGNINNVRELPNFKDVLLFDWIISDFRKKWTSQEKLYYYPIVLWWSLTLIIPMRSSEFCSLAYDCVSHKDGAYYIRIPRTKRKQKTSQDIDVTATLQINKELYDLVVEYKKLTKDFKRTPYLLSFQAYRQSERAQKNQGAEIRKANKDLFEVTQFYILLKNFYREIAQNKYGFSHISKLRPMDTRHYAFCNMMLQGFNMLTIARIGGHHKLDTQMHYFNHLKHLNESSIQYLSDQYKKMSLISQYNENPLLSENVRRIKAKSLTTVIPEPQLKKLHKLPLGYCTYDPSQCPVGDCRHCQHFYVPFEELTQDVFIWLGDESERLQSRIKEQLELMKNLSINMSYNFVTLEYDQLSQAELSYLSSNMKKLRQQKAWTDAHREAMKKYLFGGENGEEKGR